MNLNIWISSANANIMFLYLNKLLFITKHKQHQRRGEPVLLSFTPEFLFMLQLDQIPVCFSSKKEEILRSTVFGFIKCKCGKVLLVPVCSCVMKCQVAADWRGRDVHPLKHKLCWCLNAIHPINHPCFFHKPFETGAVVCYVMGLNGILNWTRHSYLQLHCVSRASAFPFSAWQYPSFLFISLLSGRRKWITGLSRRGTGAITWVCEKKKLWYVRFTYFLFLADPWGMLRDITLQKSGH